MKNLINKVVAITGGGSGIGRALAINLAEEGCHLAVADINPENLRETAHMLEAKNVKVTTHVIDVSKREQVYKFAEDVIMEHGSINIVINNAGVSLAGKLEEVSYQDYEWLFGINFWGVVYGCKAFLPYLHQSPESHIVNISSVGGFATAPNYGTYCSSKFAIRGFTQTLMQELAGTTVGVTCVYPGGIRTNILKNTRLSNQTYTQPNEKADPRKIVMDADKAAKIIIKAIKQKKSHQLVGIDAHIMYALSRFCPHMLNRIISSKFKSQK